MNRFVNAVVIGLAVFVVGVSAVWFLAQSGSSGRVEVGVDEVEWVDNGTTMRAHLAVVNGLSRTATLTGMEYAVRIEDSVLFEGSSRDTLEVGRGDTAGAVVDSELPGDLGARWWRLHLESGESSVLRIEGEAVFDVGGKKETARFERQWRFETDLTEGLQGGIESCPSDPVEPCLDDVDMEWRDGGDFGTLRYEIRVFNPYDQPLVVTGQDARLEWAEVTVAGAESRGEVVIDPGESQLVTQQLVLDGRALAAWWGVHVDRCESSLARVLVEVPFEVRDGGGNETVLRDGSLRFGSAGADIKTQVTCGGRVD